MPVMVKNNQFLLKNLVAWKRWKISRNMSKLSRFAIECSKMRCRLGLRPRPRWESAAGGAYSAPQDPLAVRGEGRRGDRRGGNVKN